MRGLPTMGSRVAARALARVMQVWGPAAGPVRAYQARPAVAAVQHGAGAAPERAGIHNQVAHRNAHRMYLGVCRVSCRTVQVVSLGCQVTSFLKTVPIHSRPALFGVPRTALSTTVRAQPCRAHYES